MSRQEYIVGQGLGQAKKHVFPVAALCLDRNAFLSSHFIVYKK